MTEVVETGYDNSRGQPAADLLDGMGEPGSLASIPIRRSVLPDQARKRPSALAAGSFDGRCLTLELGWVPRARVPDHAVRGLVAVRLWRRGRRLATACPSMWVGGRRRVGWGTGCVRRGQLLRQRHERKSRYAEAAPRRTTGVLIPSLPSSASGSVAA